MSAAIDAGRLLDHGAWSPLRKAVFGLSALAILFDGFDIQLLAFAIPSLMKEWQVPRSSFAPVLAVGLIGMSLGTALAGYLGDRMGRKRGLIFSVLAFGAATLATVFVSDPMSLGVMRFLAGAGLGGAVPNATTLSAEFTPLRRRALAVSMTIVCVPLGGVLAGAVASQILEGLGWRYLFAIGGASALFLAALLAVALPESARFLVRRPARWPELAALLTRLGEPVPIDSQFADSAEQRKETGNAARALLGPEMFRNTASLWVCFLSSMLSIYLALNWLPTLLASQGFSVGAASSGLAMWNLGGVLGAVCCGALIHSLGSRTALMAACAGAIAASLWFWMAPPSPVSGGPPLLALTLHGFFANAVQACLFALAAHIYPTKVRATGMAAAVALGRSGAVVSSFLGPSLVQSGSSPYFGAIALSLVVTLLALASLRDHIPRRPA